MQAAIQRICFLTDRAQARNTKRARVSLVIAALLAALLWRTTWPSLRPGLIVLLIAYAGTAGLFRFRNVKLASEARDLRAQTDSATDLLSWFDREEKFVKWAAFWETGLRTAGFLILGYGFWLATRSSATSLLLGIGYPALTYFGMERRNSRQAAHRLKTERDALVSLLAASPDSGSAPNKPVR